MSKSKKKNISKVILTILTMLIGAVIFLPLILNDWTAISKFGDTTNTAEAGKFFDDYSSVESLFELADSKLITAMSTVAGIAVIVAICAAALYIIFAIINLCGKRNKLCRYICNAASVIMIIAGIIALVAGLVFCIPTASISSANYSLTFDIGAYLAVALPIVAGILGIYSTK